MSSKDDDLVTVQEDELLYYAFKHCLYNKTNRNKEIQSKIIHDWPHIRMEIRKALIDDINRLISNVDNDQGWECILDIEGRGRLKWYSYPNTPPTKEGPYLVRYKENSIDVDYWKDRFSNPPGGWDTYSDVYECMEIKYD